MINFRFGSPAMRVQQDECPTGKHSFIFISTHDDHSIWNYSLTFARVHGAFRQLTDFPPGPSLHYELYGEVSFATGQDR